MKNILKKIYYFYLLLRGENEKYGRSIGVKIGSGCRILTRYFGSEPYLIEIGDKVTISRDVIFINHDGSTWLMRDERGRRQSFRQIRIGSNVFVGARTVILPGVSIGDFVVVGAGSVLTKSIPSGWVVAGNPARLICSFEDLRGRMLTSLPAEDNLPKLQGTKEFALAALDPTFKAELIKEKNVR